MINNAAAEGGKFRLTAEKVEHQIATNHVGPFLFTKLIVPKLLAAGSATCTPRVVFVSSLAHSMCAGLDLTDIENPDPAKYNGFGAYAQTKVANILTAMELSKRSKGSINAYSLHPGGMYV